MKRLANRKDRRLIHKLQTLVHHYNKKYNCTSLTTPKFRKALVPSL